MRLKTLIKKLKKLFKNNKKQIPVRRPSKAETRIASFLNNKKINYREEFIFQDLINPRTGKHLRFDFAIFDNNDKLVFLLEYQGKQHYKQVEGYDKLGDIKYRDALKSNYAIKKGLTLYYIGYKQYDNIEKILYKYLKRENLI